MAAVLGVLLLSAGAVTLWYVPKEQVYRSAMATSETADYADALAAIDGALDKLRGQPLFDRKVEALEQRRLERAREEIRRAVDKDETDYASELLDNWTPQDDATRETLQERERAHAYSAADALELAGDDEAALEAFLALGTYSDAAARAAKIRARLDYAAASAVFDGTNFNEAIAALRALGTAEANAAAAEIEQLQAEYWVAYRADVLVRAEGSVAAGAWHTAVAGEQPNIFGDARYPDAPQKADRVVSGLTSVLYLQDGRVLLTGESFGAEETVSALTDVIDAAAGLSHALFLHADGAVTGVGGRAFGRIDTSDWTEIRSVAAGAWHSVGAKADGTVLAIGNNDHGQCDVSDWTDVTAVAAGLWHTVGLKADGTAVAAGENTYGQCDVSDWTDLVAVACGACTTVGLKADGTVVAVGDNGAGQCDVANWTDVAAIAAGAYHTVAVRLDGRLIGTGRLPDQLPAEPVFASDWQCEPAPDGTVGETATAYIEGQEASLGPWLYLDETGAATICVDDYGYRTPFRTDLFARANALPTGYVTNPEASGNVIRMSTELPEVQARQHHAVIAFTGDYIGYTSNRKAVMMRNGTVYYDRAETTTYAILPDGTLQIYEKGETTADALLALGVKDSFSFGPVLVRDGVNVAPATDTYTMRVAFGYSDPYHYIVAISMRDRSLQMTYSMIADACVQYGCRTAYNLDGGHSTSLVFLGRELSTVSLEKEKLHTNIRGLSDIIAFLQNDSVN